MDVGSNGGNDWVSANIKMKDEDISRLEAIATELKALEGRLQGDRVQLGAIDITGSARVLADS